MTAKSEQEIVVAKREIKGLEQDNKRQENKITFSSPLAQKNNVDLTEAESKAIKKITKGLKITFGDLKKKEDFKNKKGDIARLMGKNFANYWVIPNHDTEYVGNDFAKCYFGNVTDVFHAPCFAFTQYKIVYIDKTIPTSIAFQIDYDLVDQKINSWKPINFLTQDVLDYQGSDL